MGVLTPHRRARAGIFSVVGATSLALTMTLLPSAHAATPDPSTQVQQLLAKVNELQAKVDVAERKYSRSFTTVTQSVSRAISADQESNQVQIVAANAQAELLDKVRGLYESGGPLAAYAQLLDTGNVASALDRTMLVSRVVSAQVASVRDVQRVAAASRRAADRAEHQEHARIQTVSTINEAASRVGALLAQQKQLLDSANQALAAVQAAQAKLKTQTAHFSSIGNSAAANSSMRILPPSSDYLSLYQTAASYCPGLSWTILAAIGQVESGHGRNIGPSYAGAMGQMQFMPATFAAYAIDGDGDGTKSIVDPADSIYSAANYLCANGAGHGGNALYNAIWHYNHADWYVSMVENLAALYATAYT